MIHSCLTAELTSTAQVMREAGVVASRAKHVYVMMNGAFFGLYALVEEVDSSFLRHNDLPASSSLYKSSQGKIANLRWDVTDKRLIEAYQQVNIAVRNLMC